MQNSEISGEEQALTAAQAVEPTDEHLMAALSDEGRREKLVFSNDALVNAVIERYLDELSGAKSVPVVRGLSALCPVAKPKTLGEAKKIVDGF